MPCQKGPAHQHYLPKMYLKNFCNYNGKVWVYNDKNQTFKELSITDTTVIKHFYTILDNNGSKDYRIENSLSKIEAFCSPILKKLIDGQQISSEEKGYLSVFISVLQNRTPKAVKLINEFVNPILELTNKQILYYKQSELVEEGEKLGLSRKVINKLMENSKISLTKEGEWGLLMETALKMAELYSQMEWHFIYTENSSFITTDNPVLVYPAKFDTGPYGNVGIAIPTTEKHITIAPNLILRICDLGNPSIYYHILNDKEKIRIINEQQLKFREQFAIARDNGHLEYLVKRTNNKKFKTYIKVN